MIQTINGNSEYIPLTDQSVHCVITSPPYYALRDYGVSGQIGLEATPAEYIRRMMKVFSEVWRVLRDDGTLWVNMGDSYAGGNQTGRNDNGRPDKTRGWPEYDIKKTHLDRIDGAKPKDMLGIPWRLAFALQDAGWYLRSDIIWHKPNPMPESVTDRPTKAHEYIFLLAKREKYFYDAEAVKEEISENSHYGGTYRTKCYNDAVRESMGNNSKTGITLGKTIEKPENGRNRRTVWTIATSPYSGAHFATFPPKLVEPCILAGTSARGCCPSCGAQWERVIERTGHENKREPAHAPRSGPTKTDNTGWRPLTRGTDDFIQSCTCPSHDPIPCTVLDPFAGTSTVGRVAAEYRRSFVGVELNPEYIQLARKRTSEIGVRLF